MNKVSRCNAKNNFIKFLKETNVKNLDISKNPIEQGDLLNLLKVINETEINNLDLLEYCVMIYLLLVH